MSNQITDYERLLPFMRSASADMRTQFERSAIMHRIPAGSIIGWEGDSCTQLAIVASGVVRVYKVGENGREITLYRIEPSESCVLTASCILSDSGFPAIAVAETDVEALLIPASTLRLWVERYEPWRSYVFSLLSQRLSNVIATVEEVTFRRMDVRIAGYLTSLGEDGDTVEITHQDIAFELGTAREVVSRILKDLERNRLIKLSRGAVMLQDVAGLSRYAEMR
jgi:CRP/FNR family transcriptional regulator